MGTMHKLLTLSLEMMESGRQRGDALYEIYKELEEKTDFEEFTKNRESAQNEQVCRLSSFKRRGEGIFRGCSIQTVNVFLGEIDIGRPSRTFPVIPPGIRVTYHGGSIELSITRSGNAGKTD